MTDPTRRPNPPAGKGPAKPQSAGAAPRPAAARPAPAAARPAAQPAPAPRARPAPVEPEPVARRSPVRRDTGPADEPLDSTTKKGLIAAGVMVVIGAVIWIVTSNQKAAAKQAIDDLNAMVQGFHKDIEDVVKDDSATEAQIEAAIARVDKEADKWQKRTTESSVVSHRSRLVGKLDHIKRRTECLAAVKAGLEAVDAAATKSSEELVNAKKSLADNLLVVGQFDPSLEDKIKAALVKIDHILVTKMRDEAKAFTALSSTTPRQGLAKYAVAEDYVRKAIEDAKKSGNKADDAAYTEIYKGLLQDSDEYSGKVITSEFIESIPWKDLLSGEMGTKWSTVQNVPGFSRRVENGILTVSPPDPGGKLLGIVGILDQPQDNLRHFQLDMDFTVDGVVTMYYHVAPPPGSPSNLQSETFDLAAGDGKLKAGAKYNLVASYIGSNLVVQVTGNDDSISPYRPDPRWSMRRKGGIAFVIPEGARLRVTKMRIKELR